MLFIIIHISICYKNVTKNDATVNSPHWNFSMQAISLIAVFKSWHLWLRSNMQLELIYPHSKNSMWPPVPWQQHLIDATKCSEMLEGCCSIWWLNPAGLNWPINVKDWFGVQHTCHSITLKMCSMGKILGEAVGQC